MSKLSNDHRKGAKHEQLVLKNLEKFTGYKAWNTPLWEKIDFTLSNDNFVNIIGEIKTRQNLFKFGISLMTSSHTYYSSQLTTVLLRTTTELFIEVTISAGLSDRWLPPT